MLGEHVQCECRTREPIPWKSMRQRGFQGAPAPGRYSGAEPRTSPCAGAQAGKASGHTATCPQGGAEIASGNFGEHVQRVCPPVEQVAAGEAEPRGSARL